MGPRTAHAHRQTAFKVCLGDGSRLRRRCHALSGGENGFEPVVPPNPKRKEPWDYDKRTYKRRNEVERLFRRIKQHRRIFTRYDKLDVVFMGFMLFAFTVEFIRTLC